MGVFDGLGKALRWLRARQDRRQYQVAEAAGVTKAMLSAYETNKQKPSLETLEKILDGLGATLGDLHQALRTVQGQSDGQRSPERKGLPAFEAEGLRGGELDLHRILGVEEPLPVEEEQAMQQMLLGFHGLLRYLHHRVNSSHEPAPAEAAGAPEAAATGAVPDDP